MRSAEAGKTRGSHLHPKPYALCPELGEMDGMDSLQTLNPEPLAKAEGGRILFSSLCLCAPVVNLSALSAPAPRVARP